MSEYPPLEAPSLMDWGGLARATLSEAVFVHHDGKAAPGRRGSGSPNSRHGRARFGRGGMANPGMQLTCHTKPQTIPGPAHAGSCQRQSAAAAPSSQRRRPALPRAVITH